MAASQPSLERSRKNCVTIRAWFSNAPRAETFGSAAGVAAAVFGGGQSRDFGHISLQTYGEQGEYMSFWPHPDTSAHGALRDLAWDEKAEGGPPDEICNLYSLNIAVMNEEFRKFDRSGCRFSLFGSGIFSNDRVKNCVGSAYDLLDKGGINSLLNIADSRTMTGFIEGAVTGAVRGFYALEEHQEEKERAGGKESTDPTASLLLIGITTVLGAVKGVFSGGARDVCEWVIKTPHDLFCLIRRAKEAENEKYLLHGEEVSTSSHSAGSGGGSGGSAAAAAVVAPVAASTTPIATQTTSGKRKRDGNEGTSSQKEARNS